MHQLSKPQTARHYVGEAVTQPRRSRCESLDKASSDRSAAKSKRKTKGKPLRKEDEGRCQPAHRGGHRSAEA